MSTGRGNDGAGPSNAPTTSGAPPDALWRVAENNHRMRDIADEVIILFVIKF